MSVAYVKNLVDNHGTLVGERTHAFLRWCSEWCARWCSEWVERQVGHHPEHHSEHHPEHHSEHHFVSVLQR